MSYTALTAAQLAKLAEGDRVVALTGSYGVSFGNGIDQYAVATVSKITAKRTRFTVTVGDKELTYNAHGQKTGGSYNDTLRVLDIAAEKALVAESNARTGYVVLVVGRNLAKLDSEALALFFATLDRDLASLIVVHGAKEAANKIVSNRDAQGDRSAQLTKVYDAFFAAFDSQKARGAI